MAAGREGETERQSKREEKGRKSAICYPFCLFLDFGLIVLFEYIGLIGLNVKVGQQQGKMPHPSYFENRLILFYFPTRNYKIKT